MTRRVSPAELRRLYEQQRLVPAEIAERLGVSSRTVRAWLELDGDILGVRTLSAPRLDAVLAELRTALPDARVDSDERRPMAPDAAAPPAGGPVDEAMREALLQLADRHERQWCEEHVPALGGRTPRQAAADPTRRDELARLIARTSADAFGEDSEQDRLVRSSLETRFARGAVLPDDDGR